MRGLEAWALSELLHVHLRRQPGEADWLVIAAGRGPDVQALHG